MTELAGGFGRIDVTVLEAGEIVRQISTGNQILVGYDELVIQAFDPNPDVPLPDAVTELAIGVDNTTPSYQNTELNDEVYAADIVSVDRDGTVTTYTAYLDTNEANGNDLVEGGLRTDTGTLLNHGTYDSITKTDTREVVFDATITQDSS